jgi:hypothetical protein
MVDMDARRRELEALHSELESKIQQMQVEKGSGGLRDGGAGNGAGAAGTAGARNLQAKGDAYAAALSDIEGRIRSKLAALERWTRVAGGRGAAPSASSSPMEIDGATARAAAKRPMLSVAADAGSALQPGHPAVDSDLMSVLSAAKKRNALGSGGAGSSSQGGGAGRGAGGGSGAGGGGGASAGSRQGGDEIKSKLDAIGDSIEQRLQQHSSKKK